jgi:uncharacterized repeat protein (TIGR01451 family)
LAAPTLDNIDADPDLEVVINTAHAGLVAYDLPGTASARILWQTGRGSYQRAGSLIRGSLETSVTVSDTTPQPGDTFDYTITMQNSGPLLSSAYMTDTLPLALTYSGNLTASTGSANESGGVITWHGSVGPTAPVTISFALEVDAGLAVPTIVENDILFDDGEGAVMTQTTRLIVGGVDRYLPVVRK